MRLLQHLLQVILLITFWCCERLWAFVMYFYVFQLAVIKSRRLKNISGIKDGLLLQLEKNFLK